MQQGEKNLPNLLEMVILIKEAPDRSTEISKS